jgi:KDO2-lipid IV(A) lauroyltransferase
VVTASRALSLFRVADGAVRAAPLPVSIAVARRLGAHVGPRLMPTKARLLGRHLDRVAAHGPLIAPADGRATVRRGFDSYARYWAESIALPHLSTAEIDRGFSFVGYDRIEDVRATGKGPILVLPHLGGWEWAAAWLGRVSRVPVTAVVEALEPPDLFEWFRSLRTSYGVNVVPLGSEAFSQVTTAIRDGHVVCLLADRDIGGSGVEVEFFGETTTMPVGPAVLSSRTGSPVLPTAVYFNRDQRITMVGRPIPPDTMPSPGAADRPSVQATDGRRVPVGEKPTGRRRYRHLTQLYAWELERLIAAAPSQWHLLEPNWPSDRRLEQR